MLSETAALSEQVWWRLIQGMNSNITSKPQHEQKIQNVSFLQLFTKIA